MPITVDLAYTTDDRITAYLLRVVRVDGMRVRTRRDLWAAVMKEKRNGTGPERALGGAAERRETVDLGIGGAGVGSEVGVDEAVSALEG